MSWRDGQQFERCLTSIVGGAHHSQRIVLSFMSSVNSENSDDMKDANAFQEQHPQVDVICTGKELPPMQHQASRVDYIDRSVAQPTDWGYWLAHDDEPEATGIDAITDDDGELLTRDLLTPHDPAPD